MGDFYLLMERLDTYLAGTPPEELEAKVIDQLYTAYHKIWITLSEAKLQHRRKN